MVMLRGGISSRVAGYAGLAGFGLLLLFELTSSFFAGLSWATMILAMASGLASLVWYLLVAKGFWQLAQNRGEKEQA
jgi:hypothetical protein